MRTLSTRRAVTVFLAPAVILYLLAVVMPILQSLWLSLFEWDGIGPMKWTSLDNYARMARDPVFMSSFRNSLVYLGINLFFQVVVALLLANLLLSVTRGRELIKTMFFLPTIVSTVAIAFLFQRIYALEPMGIINLALDAVGLGDLATAWLGTTRTALVAVSIPEGWRFMGLYMVILYAALLAVPKDLEEAARIDGASEWKVFSRIRFPIIRPVWATVMIMAATYSLRGFDIPYLLTNGGPGTSTELLTTYMYKKAFRSVDFGYASAIAVFIVIECIIAVGLIIVILRRGRQGEGALG
ncbi:MAG: sugar ABC transporter permease [Chloroflexi bacterium]|nr:sugar ABC transporter permease [Chloroflexota bacterium]